MATTKRLDEAEIEERLRGRPIAIVKGSFKNTREPAQWHCLSDSSHGIFNAPPRQIIHANGNCPKCGKVAKLTDEIISEKLGTRHIRLISGSLQGSDVKAIWECLSDSSHGSWEATPSSILNRKSGCPKCSGKLPLNKEEIKSRLNDRALALVNGSYNHPERTATWQCLTDSNQTAFLPVLIDKQLRLEVLKGNDVRFADALRFMEWASEDFPHQLSPAGDEITIR